MKRELIETHIAPEFGELTSDPEFKEQGTGRDLTYVPGFSDMRMARDLAVAEVRKGKRDAKDVPTLPVNLHWTRCQRKDGTPDNSKVIQAGNIGYRAVTKDDIGQPWLLALPAGAVSAADGTIRQGDVQLMVATAEVAGKNAFYKRAQTEQRMRGAMEGFEAAAKMFRKKGSDPYVVIEKGQKVKGTIVPADNKVNPKDAS
jgi:hypothetical protein